MRLVYTRPWTSKFSYSFFCNNGVVTAEGTGYFGLQMPTGPRQIEETGFAFIDVIQIVILYFVVGTNVPFLSIS